MRRVLRAMVSAESVVLVLLVLAFLWKGGKTLELTWLLAGAGVLLHLLSQKKLHAEPLIVWCLWVCFLGLTILSYQHSIAGNYGLDELLRDAGCFYVFLWLSRYNARLSFIEKFTVVMALTLFTACSIGVIVYLFQPVSRFVGTFLDFRFATDYWPNAWAQAVLLTWPVAAYGLKDTRPLLRGALLGIILGCFILSYSRGAMLSLILQFGIISVLCAITTIRRGVKAQKKTMLPWIFTLLVSAFTAFVLFFAINQQRSQLFEVESAARKATFSAAEGTSSVSERRQFWDAAFTLSLERPVLGWGPYSFRFVQPREQTGVFATSDHPHNIFLKIAMERGLPALMIFVLLLISLLLPPLLAVTFPRGRSHALWEAVVLVSVGGLLAHNMIDYNVQFVGIALPLWILLGSVSTQSTAPSPVRFIIERVGVFALTLLLLIEGGFLVTSSLGRHADAGGDPKTALSWYELSKDEWFSRDLHLSRASLYQQSGQHEKAAGAMTDALKVNEADARAWLMLGNELEGNGDNEGALEAYERAWISGKYNYLNILSGFMRVYLEQNDEDSLVRREEEFVSVYKAFADAILRNTHFIALSQTTEELQHVAPLLKLAYPEHTAEIQKLEDAAVKNATEERARFDARRAGLLW